MVRLGRLCSDDLVGKLVWEQFEVWKKQRNLWLTYREQEVHEKEEVLDAAHAGLPHPAGRLDTVHQPGQVHPANLLLATPLASNRAGLNYSICYYVCTMYHIM